VITALISKSGRDHDRLSLVGTKGYVMRCQLLKLCKWITPVSENLQSIALLLIRLILAYTFFSPAMMKWADIGATASWFEQMGIPQPTLNAYMAAGTEMTGVVLLTLGLFSRLISIPLLVTMFVAIVTVHGSNGYSVISDTLQWSDAYVNGAMVEGTVVFLQNGYENVLNYIAMLLVILGFGPGKISLDQFIREKIDRL